MRKLWWMLLATSLTMLVTTSALAVPTIAFGTGVPNRYPANDDNTIYGCPGRNSQANSCLVDGTSQGIGYHDCLDDTRLKFSLILTQVPDPNYNLQVWAGTTDCTQAGATNNATTGTCWPVYQAPNLSVSMVAYIRVADIVRYLGEGPPNLPTTYTPADATTACNAAAGTSVPTTVMDDAGNSTSTAGESTVTIYFMIFQNGQTTQPAVPGVNFSVKVKLVGPNAVTGVAAGEGENELIVSWTPPIGDTTVQGYNVYAAPNGTVVDDGGQTVCSDAQAGTELLDDAGNPILDDAGNPIYVDDAGNPVAPDAGCTTAAPSVATCDEAGSTFDVASISCPTGGDAGAVVCAQASGVTQDHTTVTGLANGTSYAVAVAAFDQFGNSGAVATAACGTPKPIDDFWKKYIQAGGNVSCALEGGANGGAAVIVASASVLGLAFARRRRKGRSERR